MGSGTGAGVGGVRWGGAFLKSPRNNKAILKIVRERKGSFESDT